MTLDDHARLVLDLLTAGQIEDASRGIAAHAALAEQLEDSGARLDAAAWRVMRALLDGRHADARLALEETEVRHRRRDDAAVDQAHSWQRYWLLAEWGTDAEREDLLDFCRRRAYFHNELGWRSALTLLLARMGYVEEAAREFDTVIAKCLNNQTQDAAWLDIMTNVGEAAAILGHTARARAAYGALGRWSGRSVLVGAGWVCKGSTSRVLGLLAATLGRGSESDRHFAAALERHRDMEALPLVARTCTEWGHAIGTRDAVDAVEYLDEGFDLAGRLGMTYLAATARAALDSVSQPLAS